MVASANRGEKRASDESKGQSKRAMDDGTEWRALYWQRKTGYEVHNRSVDEDEGEKPGRLWYKNDRRRIRVEKSTIQGIQKVPNMEAPP